MSNGPSSIACYWVEAHAWLVQVNRLIYGAAQAAREESGCPEDEGARLRLLRQVAPLWIMYRAGDPWESRVLATCGEIRDRRSRRGDRAVTIAPDISGTSHAEALCKLGRYLTRGTMDDRRSGCERLARIVQTCFPSGPDTDPQSIGIVLTTFASAKESHLVQTHRMLREMGRDPSVLSALTARFFGQELDASMAGAARGEMAPWLVDLLQDYPYRQVAAELELEFAVPTGDQHDPKDLPKGRKKPGRPKKESTEQGRNLVQLEMKLYTDYEVARRTSRVTKAEFLRDRGLPAGDLAALERGRKLVEKERKGAGKN